MRLALVIHALAIAGCDLYYEPAGPPGDDSDPAPVEQPCQPVGSATISEPAPGPYPSTTVIVRAQWAATTNGRYISMRDHFSNFFISSSSTTAAEDSLVAQYDMPAGGRFVLELGTWCHVGGDDYVDVVLAGVEFTTPP